VIHRLVSFIAFAALVTSSSVFAADSPKLSPKPQGAEVQFVDGIQKDLTARFATPKDAEAAGYFHYTNEDDTGAISYANLQWTSADPQHPSQLWYDVNGNLLGADFSQPNSVTPPKLWGVLPGRWLRFRHPHVHYILAVAGGPMKYGLATSGKKFTAAGGNLDSPQAATIVKLGLAKSAVAVRKVFTFPALWDLIVWVKANPDGAFADKNPLVKPSANADKGSM
jgi:hypothetical protein